MGTIQSTSAQAIEKILFQILASMHMLKLNNYVCTLYQYCPRKYVQNTTLINSILFYCLFTAKGLLHFIIHLYTQLFGAYGE